MRTLILRFLFFTTAVRADELLRGLLSAPLLVPVTISGSELLLDGFVGRRGKSGGRRGHPELRRWSTLAFRSRDQACDSNSLVDAWAALGRTTHVPALWVYAENDDSYGPDLARRMFDAYNTGGASAQLHVPPPFGSDGHDLIIRAPVETWLPSVEPFLVALALPTAQAIVLPPPAELPPRRAHSLCVKKSSSTTWPFAKKQRPLRLHPEAAAALAPAARSWRLARTRWLPAKPTLIVAPAGAVGQHLAEN